MPNAPQVFGRRQIEERRGNCVDRGYDWHWMKISRMYRNQHPICQYCNQNPAEDVDHVIPFNGLKDPLRTAWSNLKSTCRQCHNAKTHGGR